MKKIKINSVDRIFSKAVRARAGWCCEVCGEYHGPSSTGLHCSHFFSRRMMSVRWHPLNVAAHCAGCHSHLGGNPIEFTEWIKSHLGADYSTLIDLKNTTVRFRDKDRKAIREHFKAELERIEDTRSRGVEGRIELKPYIGDE